MKISRFTRTLLVLLLTPAAGADLISWGPVQDVTGVADVRTGGTLVTARNPWAQTFASPTIAGVPFTAWAPPGWNNGGWTLNVGSSTGDADYDAMLDSARVTTFGSASNPNGPGAIRLDTLGTLEIGRTYEIQVWYSDQRVGNGANFLNDRRMTFSSATGNATVSGGVVQNPGSLTQGPESGFVEADPNNTSGATDTVIGQFVVGTFTRTTTEPLYLLVEGTHPMPGVNLRPHLNGLQIRDVGLGSIGSAFCAANPNSTGLPGLLTATGSTSVASNDVTLNVEQIPAGQFGIFVVAPSAGSTTTVNSGILCLSGQIGRYDQAAFIWQADASGSASRSIDLQMIPTPTAFVVTAPGDTWFFQAWHRDVPSGNSNFTTGVEITFS